jgi:hypothetical protein
MQMSQLEIATADRPFGGHGGSFPIAADVINANGLAGADSPFTAHRAKLSISGPSSQVTCLVAVDVNSPIELVASDHPGPWDPCPHWGAPKLVLFDALSIRSPALSRRGPSTSTTPWPRAPGFQRPAMTQSDLGQNGRVWRRWRGWLTRCCEVGRVFGRLLQQAEFGLRQDH